MAEVVWEMDLGQHPDGGRCAAPQHPDRRQCEVKFSPAGNSHRMLDGGRLMSSLKDVLGAYGWGNVRVEVLHNLAHYIPDEPAN